MSNEGEGEVGGRIRVLVLGVTRVFDAGVLLIVLKAIGFSEFTAPLSGSTLAPAFPASVTILPADPARGRSRKSFATPLRTSSLVMIGGTTREASAFSISFSGSALNPS